MIPREEFFAREAYAAYGTSTGGKNFRGDPMPTWEDLPKPIKDAWIAAANRISQLCDDEVKGALA